MKPPHEFKVLRVRECAAPDLYITTPEEAAAYWRANIPESPWYDESKEALVVLVLNTRRRIIGHNLVSLGGLNSTTAHPREVFRPVICSSGAACILAHNHPSGDPTPSDADIMMTRQVYKAG